MRVGIATDHGGSALKEELLSHLREARYEVVDFGAFTQNPDDDYPDFVIPLAEALAEGRVERGIAICGSGLGASVCANKIPGIRAALIADRFSARQGVEDVAPRFPAYEWNLLRVGDANDIVVSNMRFSPSGRRRAAPPLLLWTAISATAPQTSRTAWFWLRRNCWAGGDA